MPKTFAELGLGDSVLAALKESGFETPFPIQEAAIPLILQGKDVLGQAHTGTGKTAAFALPLLSKMGGSSHGSRQPQALVLVPTRELAVQVTGEINRLARHTPNARAVAVYGGESFGLQREKLRKGPQIIVATPGRLIDHLQRSTIRLGDIMYVVLDEADRMLDMGFIDDIKFILSRISNNRDRQTMLFSATMSQEILKLARDYMRKGDMMREVRLNTEQTAVKSVSQAYLLVGEQEKFVRLVDIMRPLKEQAIVFAATKNRTDRLARDLRQEGFRCSAIHGDLHQKQRDTVMQRFRKGADSVLVATDIAARGIDVPAVGHVINYDVPIDTETYFHRIGRTARAGAQGRAVSLVTPDRFPDFEKILRQSKGTSSSAGISRLNEEMGIPAPARRSMQQPSFVKYRRDHHHHHNHRRHHHQHNDSSNNNRTSSKGRR
ncbi:DEAD/DEAH box helicase [Nitrososphaera sp.]|uniref:DEAD/DEAH box helicase n=1 Tax=Nitrososphaera sp. TaxID=1971748 RepID=UPI00307EFFA2